MPGTTRSATHRGSPDAGVTPVPSDRRGLWHHRAFIPRKLEREEEFCEQHVRSRALSRALSFEEVIVEIGARIFVQGMAIVETDPTNPTSAGYRDVPR